MDVWIVTIPHPTPIRWAGVVETDAQYLLVKVNTDRLQGVAQLKIHPAWTGTSPRLTAQALLEVYDPLLRGVNPLAAERTRAAMEQVRGWSPAKVLLDVALTDLRARHAGLPLRTYLGGWADQVPVAGLITRGPRAHQVEMLKQGIERHGFRAFKVKIGTNARDDIALLQDLRSADSSIGLSVDANSGYTARDALFVADALAELDVTHFEDPCPLGGPAARREVFAKSPVRVLVDRVVDSARTAREVIMDGAHAVSIKVQRVGYRQGRQILDICDDQGVPVVAGLNSEATLGALSSLQMYAAYRQFAGFPAEESHFASLSHDVTVQVPKIRDGAIVLPDGPGLGVEVDPESLARFGVQYQP